MWSTSLKYGLKWLLPSVLVIVFVGNVDAKDQRVKFTTPADHLIDTDGCFIPNYAKPIKEAYLKYMRVDRMKCKPRLVHIDRTFGDRYRFRIDEDAKRKLKAEYLEEFHQRFYCGYRILALTTSAILSKVHVLTNGETLDIDEDSVVIVTCTYLPDDLKHLRNSTNLRLYKDAYILYKKLEYMPELQHNTRWNVLLYGLESMSRAKMYDVMPEVVKYLNFQGWLDFRGHHLVSSSFIPNLLAISSGSNKTFFNSQDVVWHEFSLFGYESAIGHDVTKASKLLYKLEKLQKEYKAKHQFRVIPSFMKYTPNCFGRLPVAEHMLNYAAQFVETNRHDNFYGLFFSADNDYYDNRPHPLQTPLIDFLERIRRVGALKNTFVFLFGGAKGKVAKANASNGSEKLTMFFMWVPADFRQMYPNNYRNVKENQFRFTNHYDLYETLRSILQLSEPVVDASGGVCKTCTSLFKRVSLSRSCSTALLDNDLCGCQNKTQVSDEMTILGKIMDKPQEDAGGHESVFN